MGLWLAGAPIAPALGCTGVIVAGQPAGQGGPVRGVPRAGAAAHAPGRGVGAADDAELDVHQTVLRAAPMAAGELGSAGARRLRRRCLRRSTERRVERCGERVSTEFAGRN